MYVYKKIIGNWIESENISTWNIKTISKMLNKKNTFFKNLSFPAHMTLGTDEQRNLTEADLLAYVALINDNLLANSLVLAENSADFGPPETEEGMKISHELRTLLEDY